MVLRKFGGENTKKYRHVKTSAEATIWNDKMLGGGGGGYQLKNVEICLYCRDLYDLLLTVRT
jgi:hypothetical protein